MSTLSPHDQRTSERQLAALRAGADVYRDGELSLSRVACVAAYYVFFVAPLVVLVAGLLLGGLIALLDSLSTPVNAPRGAMALAALFLAGGLVALMNWVERRRRRGLVPRGSVELHLPICYRCKFDLSGLLTDDPHARVRCPECGHRQKRSRAPAVPPQ